MLPRRPLAAALALASLAMVVPAAAFHDPGLPVLDEVPLTADGYAAWRLFVPAGGQVSFDIEAGDAPGSDLVATQLFLMRTDPLRFDSGFAFAAGANNGALLHAAAAAPVGSLLHQASPGSGVRNGLGVTLEPNADSEFIAVAILASDAGLDGHLVLYGGPGVQVRGATTGPAFLFREPDFAGTVNVVAQQRGQSPAPELPGQGAVERAWYVRAVEGASRAVEVEGRLFGAFYGLSNTHELQLGYDRPGGSAQVACQPNAQICEAYELFTDGASGEWTFRIDHALDYYDTGLLCGRALSPVPQCFLPVLYAAGADVAMP